MRKIGNLKKIMMMILSVFATACVFAGVANLNATAEETTLPVVTDGSRIEMESVTPNGTPTGDNDTMVFEKETASGGAVIGNWGNADNNVTYKFTVEEATKARIGIALVTGWGGTNLITRVNGVDVSFADSFDPFTDWDNGWYNFKVYNLEEVDLVAGENTLYLEAYEGSNFNFDYITFTFIADGEETHVCEYVDGKCVCGNLKIEVESVTPNGTPTDGNPTFIYDQETASGGKVIGNWGNGDTNVTYTFTAEEAGYARVGIALVTGWRDTQLLTKVNGVEVKFTSSFAPFTDWDNGWYNFKVYYLEVAEVVAGENTIYLEAFEGSNFNFDYILVDFVEKPEHVCKSVCEICGKCLNAACEEEVCADKCQGHHEHSWTDGRCECGAALLEAEDTDWANTIESTDSSGMGVIIEQTELASGGWIVGNWGKTGNKIVWAIELDKATTASMTLYAAPCSPANNFSAVMKLTVNGEEVGLVNDAMPGLVGSAWYDFKAFETNAVEFPAGKVTIVLEMLVDGYFTNVDCLAIALPADVTISMSDGLAPEISDIEVKSTDLTAGKEIEFTYTVSDNKTATENITVETKVYLNYNRDSQEEIACVNNKFTPTKEGRYTIVITATDEAGNVTKQTRALSISAAETPVTPGTPDTPDKPETPDTPDTSSENEGIFAAIGNWEPIPGWPLKMFAWKTAWAAFAVVVAVFFVLYILKVWMFGRWRLNRKERAEAKELTKALKKANRAKRKATLAQRPKKIRKVVAWNLRGKFIWSVVVVLILAVSMIATPVLTTTMPYIMEALFPSNLLNPDSESAKLAIGQAKENVVKIEEEGITLLKNNEEDGKPVLPLDPQDEKDVKVNLFGSSVFGMLYGGGGSGVFVTNATSYGNELYATRLEDALEAEGFEYNHNLYNLVANYFESKTYKITQTNYDIQCQNNVFGGNTKDDEGNILIDETRFPYDNEPEASAYTRTYDGLNGQTLLEEAKAYSDIAIYAVSRAGSEDGDLTYANTLLTAREKDMIELLKSNFKRVIILVNSSNTMELGTLDDERIDSVLWIGHPGLTGNTAVAGVISGRVNPSGRLVDTWVYDGKSNPASLMFGHEGTGYYSNKNTPFQVYYEGVYLGYRYYATRGMTDPNYRYEDYVQWSFGYGLSYTTFEKHITEFEVKPEEDVVSVQVAVTNTGKVAGKDVVQIYFNAPYSGKVEKPYYELAGFKKTDVIEPDETYYARVEFAISDMASWYSEGNGGEGAYLLEAGDYTVSLRDNVWDLTADEDEEDEFVNEHVYTLNSEKVITTDPITGNDVENRFEDVEYGPNDEKIIYLSRSDWEGTYPTADKINKAASAAVRNAEYVQTYTDNQISQKDTSEYTQGVDYGLSVRDFKDVGINENITLYGETYTWDDLIDQMTVADMCKLVDSRFMGTVAIESVGKPEMGDDDGPASVSIYGVGYPSEVVVASTWNPDMGYLLGYSLGKEGAAMGMSGWYAPGLNLHRAAPGGRNFEYYSEDPLISGLMAAATVKGAKYFGIYTYIKHFALNDQETERRTIQVWANEQSMRELYLRAFEIAVKEGESVGIMSSFNFLGTTWAGGSRALMTEVLREEWGFEGVAVTDWTNPSTMPVNAGLRAGNDLWLGKNVSFSASSAYNETPDDIHYLLRQACKRILYATANSNAVWTAEDFKAVGIDDPPKSNHEAMEGYH